MTAYRKILERVLSGRSDANIRFDDLRYLLARLGFEERSRGRREGNMAKHYQVRAGKIDPRLEPVPFSTKTYEKDTWILLVYEIREKGQELNL
jgi:hypothetical protein